MGANTKTYKKLGYIKISEYPFKQSYIKKKKKKKKGKLLHGEARNENKSILKKRLY